MISEYKKLTTVFTSILGTAFAITHLVENSYGSDEDVAEVGNKRIYADENVANKGKAKDINGMSQKRVKNSGGNTNLATALTSVASSIDRRTTSKANRRGDAVKMLQSEYSEMPARDMAYAMRMLMDEDKADHFLSMIPGEARDIWLSLEIDDIKPQ